MSENGFKDTLVMKGIKIGIDGEQQAVTFDRKTIQGRLLAK